MKSEAEIQQAVRVAASKIGGRLWRNNVGAGKLENGSFVRWGLCNESKTMNEKIKSSDLIGIYPLLITQDMVGTVVGQFWAVETKPEGDTGNDSRRNGQELFHAIVRLCGGRAEFNNSGELK